MQRTRSDEKVNLQDVIDILRDQQEYCLGQAAEAQSIGKEWRASAWSFAAQRILLIMRKLENKEVGSSG